MRVTQHIYDGLEEYISNYKMYTNYVDYLFCILYGLYTYKNY